MTVPKKGGRPRLKDDPAMIDAAAVELAHGQSNAAVARSLGISRDTVRRIKERHPERLAEVRQEIELIVGENVLRRIGAATEARMIDACNPESRTGAQSYRAALEGAGIVGNRGVNVHVGDVNNTAILVADVAGMEPTERERLEQLKRQWGMA